MPEDQQKTYEFKPLLQGVLDAYTQNGLRNDRCVLFVHGLTGGKSVTWKSKQATKGFIELFLEDKDLRDYDVFTFGYRTTYVCGAPIGNAARQLQTAVETLQSMRSYKIVLVAHSLGGLVCMRYILDRLQTGNVPPVTGLLMYGTPTTGTDLVRVAKLVGFGLGIKLPIVGSIVNGVLRSQRQVNDLATGSDFLAQLHDEWALRVVNGGHDTAGIGRMWLLVRVVTGEDDIFVKEASGKGVYGAIDWLPLAYGHTELTKPESANDQRYVHAKSFLRICRSTKDATVLDRIWKASQAIWNLRTARLSENVEFQTFIFVPAKKQRSSLALTNFRICRTICAFDYVLEEEVLFGVSLGGFMGEEIWNRSPQPIYVHQLGMNASPAAERQAVQSLLSGSGDKTWASIFPFVDLKVDKQPLLPGEFVSQSEEHSNWLLRRYHLPEGCTNKLGRQVRIRVEYEAIVPSSLVGFTFSAPWILDRVNVRIVVFGNFEYFVGRERIFPRGQTKLSVDGDGTAQRELNVTYNGVLFPGSVIEARWQTRDQGSRRNRKRIPQTSEVR